MFRYFIYILIALFSFTVLSGCTHLKTGGNGEYYFEYGTKIAIGSSTEKSDDTQVATIDVSFADSPIEWLFGWMLPPAEKDGSQPQPEE